MDMSNAKPAPGSTTTTVSAPEAAAPVADTAPAPALSTSPVNADSAASHSAQQAVEATLPVEGAAPEVKDTPPTQPPPEAAPAAETSVSLGRPVSTGNESFDQVSALLSEKGVDGYSQILVEAANGEVSFASKAKLIESLGMGVADMVMKQLDAEASSIKAKGTAEATRLKEKAAEAFGFDASRGDDIWTDMAAFVQSPESGLSEADRQAMNNMLKVGGIQGDMVIADIAARYEKSQGFQKTPNLLAGDGATQSGFEPLTKQSYQAELQKVVKQFGYESKEAQALQNRRSVSMQKGY